MKTLAQGCRVIASVLGLIVVVLLATPEAQVSITRGWAIGLFADGTAAAPSVAFSSDPTFGFYVPFTGGLYVTNRASGSLVGFTTDAANRGSIQIGSGGSIGWSSSASPVSANSDTFLCRGAANVIGIGGCTSSFPAWKRNAATFDARLADDSAYANVQVATLTANTRLTDSVSQVTSGAGTGITVNDGGHVVTQTYKVTIASTAFVSAAVTSDVTIATLPAKTQIIGVYADLTQVFACTATCTSTTLSFTLGSSAGGTDLLLTFDADAATLQRGLADADLGASLTRATAIQGGKIFSWTATTPVSLRLTSGTGNIGNGSATNLSQGSVTFYLVTTRLP